MLTCSGAVATAVRQNQIITMAVARMKKHSIMRAIPVFLAIHDSQSDLPEESRKDEHSYTLYIRQNQIISIATAGIKKKTTTTTK